MPPDPYAIIDSTLREGEQTPGVRFTQDDRCEIILQLCRAGVEEIELGIASIKNGHLPELVTEARKILKETGGGQRLGLWCRCREEDIAFAATCRPDVLSLSIPASDLHISQRLGKDRAWILRRLQTSVAQARAVGIPLISLGLEDATRADREFLRQLASSAAACGVQRLRLADTVGIGCPASISSLVQMIRSQSGLACGIHTHNDFGMATANAIAALDAGASSIDATILGIGERAGNCRLEEAMAFLCLQRGKEGYRIELLPGLCRMVSRITGIPISSTHPVVGPAIFTCETGLHVHGLTINPDTYEPYSPDRVGAVRTLRFGSKSGKRAIGNHLAALGHPVNDSMAEALSNHLRGLASSCGQGLSALELLKLVTR